MRPCPSSPTTKSGASATATAGGCRAYEIRMAAAWEDVPLNGPIAGVRTVLTGHAIVGEPRASANVWHIDTGAGTENPDQAR